MRDPAIRDRRERLLELTQLAQFRTRLAEQLSGGMKQKLALACTLVHEPRIILLDEPTTGVDPVSRREFWKLLSEFLAQGITILMATPYLDEAERCSRVALLHEGQLVALDTPAHLRASLPGIVMEVIAADRDRATERARTAARRRSMCSCSASARTSASQPARRSAIRPSWRRRCKRAGDRRRKRPARPRIARRRLHRASREGNSMKRPLSVFLFLLGAANAASAQAPPLRLTLDEAVARGIEASHRLEELGARQDAAQAIEDQREAAERPQLAALAGYTRINHVEEFGVPNADGGFRVIYPDLANRTQSRIDLQWPIYTGGRLSALTRAAGAEVDAAGQDREAARADLKLEITRSFLAVLTARAAADVVRQALERTNAHLTDVRNQLSVGLVPPSDVLTIEAQQAHQRMLSIEAETIAETTTAEFKRLVGLDQDVTVELIPTGGVGGMVSPPRPARSSGSDKSGDGRSAGESAGAEVASLPHQRGRASASPRHRLEVCRC